MTLFEQVSAAYPTFAIYPSKWRKSSLEAARQIGASRRSILEWRNGTQAPEIGTLLKICDAMALSPVELLTGQTKHNLIKDGLGEAIQQRKPKRDPREFQEDVIRAQMTEIISRNEIPPTTLKAVADTLEYNRSFLKKRVPDLSQVIMDRYDQYRVAQKHARKTHLRELVHYQVYQLHSLGIYPSLQKVAAGGVGPAIKENDIRLYWKELVTQLGYSQM